MPRYLRFDRMERELFLTKMVNMAGNTAQKAVRAKSYNAAATLIRQAREAGSDLHAHRTATKSEDPWDGSDVEELMSEVIDAVRLIPEPLVERLAAACRLRLEGPDLRVVGDD